ncbi:MAG: glycyl-radical enzyme activating protein [Planctomycetota bacterium]|jgi:pyruvate formate lyase activating enzyme|nr:glycyl-radical enzyme activating protein [Planctomycetota bacterium]
MTDDSPRALIYDIQRFCLHDGPGVRTTFFYKGCPLRCPWCSNPESISREPELYFIGSKCVGCGECARACPGKRIVVRNGKAEIDRARCRRCFACAAACPTMALVRKGEWHTAEELVEKALADKPFYDESGGGITVSGGEPLLQADAAAAFLRQARRAGLRTAMETCGLASRSALEKVLPHCDLIYMDVKHPDSLRHQEIVGSPNDAILGNLRFLAGRDVRLVVRIPLIPGYNLDAATIGAYADLLVPLRVKVEALPFHRLGKNKYASVGKEYALGDEKPPDEATIARVVGALAGAGLEVTR